MCDKINQGEPFIKFKSVYIFDDDLKQMNDEEKQNIAFFTVELLDVIVKGNTNTIYYNIGYVFNKNKDIPLKNGIYKVERNRTWQTN